MSKSDMTLQRDVEEELRCDPQVNASLIGVVVDGGAVSLLGTVDTYLEMNAAEAAAKRVAGVRTVAQVLAVKVLADHEHNDTEIAAAVQNVIMWNVWIPNNIKAGVHKGRVTLEGEAVWNYQRTAAECVVSNIAGVVSVDNRITLRPAIAAVQVREKLLAALRRQASVDMDSIHVAIEGGRVTLTGHASSWQSIADVAEAAWTVPGVCSVVDKLEMKMTA